VKSLANIYTFLFKISVVHILPLLTFFMRKHFKMSVYYC